MEQWYGTGPQDQSIAIEVHQNSNTYHLYQAVRDISTEHSMVTSLPCNLNNAQSFLRTTLVHQSGASRYKFRRRRPKHHSDKGNAKIETTLGNVQPFSIDVKGGGKASRRRKVILKSKQRTKVTSHNERGRKSWRKYWSVGGSVAINAKWGDCWKYCH